MLHILTLSNQTPRYIHSCITVSYKWNSLVLQCSIMCPKDVDELANSVDPDQTAPSGAV